VKVAAIVLAAGGSTRLGRPKQLLEFRGETLIRRAVRAAQEAGCAQIVVVVGRERDKIENALTDFPATIAPNELWERGPGTSIRAGVAALTGADAAIILACDQPHVDGKLLRQIIAMHQQTQKPLIACAYAETRGIPVLFAASFFGRLLSLGDDEGAKALLFATPHDTASVPFPAGAIDIDTPEDYRALQASP
jgi:molybdenum cofactor cytidylyltransferase